MVGYKIYFYPKSFDKAMRDIDKAKKDIKEKGELLMLKLAMLGKMAAEGAYGSTKIHVTIQIVENGYEIVGNGEGICFLEFGAGDATDSGHLFANKVPFEVKAGSWSKQSITKQYFLNGYWYFGGKRYTEIRPRRGMYEAYKEITQRVYEIADEVFNG